MNYYYFTRVLKGFNNPEKGIMLKQGDVIKNVSMGEAVLPCGKVVHPIQDLLGLEQEMLISPDEEGQFFVRDYGWNQSYWFKPIAMEMSDNSDKFYRLKQGESIDKDYPMWESRETQLKWLNERKVSYFPPQEIKPIKYLMEADISKCSTLEEFLVLTNLKIEDLFLQQVTPIDPGKSFRQQGFYLGMPKEEMEKLGREHYFCFRSYIVERDLAIEPHLETTYTSPKIWVKVRLRNGKIWKVQKTYQIKTRQYENRTEFEVEKRVR